MKAYNNDIRMHIQPNESSVSPDLRNIFHVAKRYRPNVVHGTRLHKTHKLTQTMIFTSPRLPSSTVQAPV